MEATNEENVSATKDYTVRCYQKELFEHAVEKNSILVLGTGSGKTFIAIMLIKHFAEEITCGEKKTIMIANTVPLVRQQCEAIDQLTPYTVSSYDGSMGVDIWDKCTWEDELRKNEVLVMVSQIFLDLLNHNFIELSKVNLLIIDECHHSTGSHPMREVMRRYADEMNNGNKCLPRILGLTASIIQKKCSEFEIQQVFYELEKTLHSRLVTSKFYEEVLKYATKPKIVIIDYDNTLSQRSEFAEMLKRSIHFSCQDIYNENIDRKQKNLLLKVFRNIETALEDLGEWCVIQAIKFEEERFEETIKAEDQVEMADIYSFLKGKLTQLRQICDRKQVDYENPRLYTSDHVERLLRVLSEVFKNQNSRVLVFVQRRFSAFLLKDLISALRKCDPDFVSISAEALVGNSSVNPFRDLAEAKALFKKQTKVLKDFKVGKLNLLFSTSVLEEGVDVRKCNFVIRYDPPLNFRAFVQSKGRARAEGSTFILMKTTASILYKEVLGYRKFEDLIRNHCHNRVVPDENTVIRSFDDDLIEPYRPFGPLGPRITSNSSISLLNRYCCQLPHDRFTTLSPSIAVKMHFDKYVATLRLPNSAPIKLYISGQPMETTEWAKKSAYLETCKKLHEIGELTDQLLPVTKAEETLLEVPVDEKEEIKSVKVGTRKRRQIYDRKFCDAFASQQNTRAYLYSLEIEQTKEGRHGGFDKDNCVGLLCHEKLCPVSFPLYNRVWGNVMVTPTLLDSFTLNRKLLAEIKHFHKVFFEMLLNVNADVLEFNDSLDHSCLIVPLNKLRFIDYNFMKEICKISSFLHSSKDCELFSFDESKYQDAVVLRLYGEPRLYAVLSVTNETPSSPFPRSKKQWRSYKEYVENNYNCQILNEDQHLLECIDLPKDLRCYNDVPKRTKPFSQHPRLIPELCFLMPFTFQQYNHFHCLPSILHRLNGVALAEVLIRKLDIAPVSLCNGGKVINYKWTDDVIKNLLLMHPSKNICVALQENDEINFVTYNKLLFSGTKPKLRRGEGSDFIDSTLCPTRVLEALTTISANDSFNLERLEIFGDSFLKFHVSQVLYFQYSNWHEGKLTSNRAQFIKNKTLYYVGKKLEIPQIISNVVLDPKMSGPAPGFRVKDDVVQLFKELRVPATQWSKFSREDISVKADSEKCYNPWTHHSVDDKTIADSVEALIGSAILSAGLTAGHALLLAFDFKLDAPLDVPMDAFIKTEEDGISTRVAEGVQKLYRKQKLNQLEKTIGYTFKEKSFLLQAVSHPSYDDNKFTDYYQRLEFLGDAVLDFLVTGHVFAAGNLKPGRMTDVRGYFVKNATLAYSCVITGLHKYLMHFCSRIDGILSRYVDFVHQSEELKCRNNSTTENSNINCESLACDQNDLNYEEDDVDLDHVDVPKILGDMVESLIGAVYLDSNLSLDMCWKIIKFFLPSIISDASFNNVGIDCVRMVYELHPKVEVVSFPPEGPGEKARIILKVPGIGEFTGEGKNLRSAKQSAAKQVLCNQYGSDWMRTLNC